MTREEHYREMVAFRSELRAYAETMSCLFSVGTVGMRIPSSVKHRFRGARSYFSKFLNLVMGLSFV